MDADNLKSLPNHYELHLGEIAHGWSDEKLSNGIQVVSFEKQPESGVRTFATLGLSRYVVDLSAGRHIRQEVLMSASDAYSADAVAGLVLSIAEEIARSGRALLRGQVIGPDRPVIVGSSLSAIYVTNPSPFAASLTAFECGSPSIVFAYLIPITAAEASLVRTHGWSWFESRLEQQNPDIWDLARTEEING